MDSRAHTEQRAPSIGWNMGMVNPSRWGFNLRKVGAPGASFPLDPGQPEPIRTRVRTKPVATRDRGSSLLLHY